MASSTGIDPAMHLNGGRLAGKKNLKAIAARQAKYYRDVMQDTGELTADLTE